MSCLNLWLLVVRIEFLQEKQNRKQDEQQNGLSQYPADVEQWAIAEMVIKTVGECKQYNQNDAGKKVEENKCFFDFQPGEQQV